MYVLYVGIVEKHSESETPDLRQWFSLFVPDSYWKEGLSMASNSPRYRNLNLAHWPVSQPPSQRPFFWTIWRARTLLKPCFFFLRLVHAFKCTWLADFLSFGGIAVSRMPGVLHWLSTFGRAKKWQVYSLTVGLTNIWALFASTKWCSILYVDPKKCK